MNRIVILQPSYIPWLGYFDQINKADTFIFYNDTQFTRRDWRNRNKIKNSSGKEQLLTIPVETKGAYHANINEIKIKETSWREDHLKSIQFNYAKSPFFKEYFPKIKEIINFNSSNLSSYTIHTTQQFSELLGIKTKFQATSDIFIPPPPDPTNHLVEICKKLNATHYLTGDAAKNYLDEQQFKKAGITLEYHGYSHPTYQQLWRTFISHLSIIDLILNKGPNSLAILSHNMI